MEAPTACTYLPAAASADSALHQARRKALRSLLVQLVDQASRSSGNSTDRHSAPYSWMQPAYTRCCENLALVCFARSALFLQKNVGVQQLQQKRANKCTADSNVLHMLLWCQSSAVY
jgi:hypothetical protein